MRQRHAGCTCSSSVECEIQVDRLQCLPCGVELADLQSLWAIGDGGHDGGQVELRASTHCPGGAVQAVAPAFAGVPERDVDHSIAGDFVGSGNACVTAQLGRQGGRPSRRIDDHRGSVGERECERRRCAGGVAGGIDLTHPDLIAARGWRKGF